jgi:hypothetical protein
MFTPTPLNLTSGLIEVQGTNIVSQYITLGFKVNVSSSIPAGALVKIYVPKWDQESTGATTNISSVNQNGALVC